MSVARTRLGLAAGLLPLAVPVGARAAPNDGYAMSNDGALRAGAAVVLGRDAASVWYNPSAIAATQRFRLDASATAYGMKLTRVPVATRVRLPERVIEAEGRENQLVVVPTAASFVFAWPKRHLALALSFHTPIYADVETRVDLDAGPPASSLQVSTQTNMMAIKRRYHAAATIGWSPHRAFRLGASVAVVYDKDLEFIRFVSTAADTNSAATSTLLGDIDAASRIAAIGGAIGVQGELTPWLHAGAAMRIPARVVYSSFEGGQTIGVVASLDPQDVRFDTQVLPATTDEAPRWLTPWTVAFGIAVKGERFDFEVDAEASTALLDVGEVWRRRAVWNVRAGGTFAISGKWILGGGLFTDRTTQDGDDLYPTLVVDRYGGSLAVRLLSKVRLANRERAKTLVFETTLAALYAFGVGTTQMLELDYMQGGPTGVTLSVDQRTRATQHLMTAHIGSGLRF